MPKIGTVLTKIAARLGVDTTTPEFIELLSANLEVPDSIMTAFESARILTPDSAKNDPELKRLFFAQVLDGMDQKINGILDEFQVPVEARTEINGVSSTFDKLPFLAKAIKSLEAQKVGATAGEKANLQQKINELEAAKATEIQTLKQGFETERQTWSSRFQNQAVRAMIAGKNLDLSRFDGNTMQDLALNMLSKELAQKGAKIVNQNDAFVLKRAEDESLDYYENNQAVSLDSFLDQVLANNKLLAVNVQPPAPGVTGHGRHASPPSDTSANPGAYKVGSGWQSRIEQAKADFAAGQRG